MNHEPSSPVFRRPIDCSSSASASTEAKLPMPPQWRASVKLWRQIVAQSLLYSSCKPTMFRAADAGKDVAQLFDDVVAIADAIKRGASIASITDWLQAPQVRRLKAAHDLRSFLSLMESLDVF